LTEGAAIVEVLSNALRFTVGLPRGRPAASMAFRNFSGKYPWAIRSLQ
jgi:hypothetical protein